MRQRKTRTAFVAASLVGILLAGSVAQANPIIGFIQEQQEKPKVHKLPPINYIRSRDYDVKHVALDLRFDWEKKQTYGTATLTLAPMVTSLNKVTLDAASMSINSVKSADGKAMKFEYDEPKQALTVMFDRELKLSENIVLTVDYRTKQTSVAGLGGFGGGLRFFQPTAENPTKRRQIWSQGATEYNRFWFPSYDSPNDFRTGELKATIEKPFTVVSNGKLVSVKENADNTKTFHWKIDEPHTNYLTSIAASEYTEIKGEWAGIPVSSYLYPDQAKEGAISVARLPEMVRVYSEKIGIKYPYAKYAQNMVQDMGGAMENITSTTMTDTIIQDARSELDGNNDSIQAHELAHQWFGNYVTCREWSEIWLNESFATYFENIWFEHALGKDEVLYREVRPNQESSLNTWNAGNRRPIVTKYYADKDGLFDTYAYPRGAAVLHMLRTHLGDDNWWRAINHYLKTNAHKPVSTEQFRIAVEEATGQSMDWFFDQWIYKMGHPKFEVTQNYDAARKKFILTVKQTQKIDSNWEYPQVEFFRTMVDVEIGTGANTRVERVWVEPKETNVFEFAADTKPLLVNFDYQGTLIKELKFDKPTAELVYQLQNDKDVLGRHWAMRELASRYKKPDTAAQEKAQILTALTTAIKGDGFWGIRRDAINQLAPPAQNSIAAALGSSPAPQLPAEYIAALKSVLKDEKTQVRTAALNILSTTKDAGNADLYLAALNDRSYNVIDSAANALGATKDARAYERLVKLLDEQSWKNRVRVAGLNGLATLGDKRALDIGFKYSDATNPANVRTAALGIVASAGKGDARAYPLIFENFKKSVDNNDFQSIFTGLTSIIRLGDPRGQEAFDLMKQKFANSEQIMNFVGMLEGQFKKSLETSAAKTQ
jgi:aminopeptidase N